MNTYDEHPGNAFLFEIATFLVMCAKECLDPFNKHYAPLRMLRTIGKLADFPLYVTELKEDRFLQQIKQELENAGSLVMNEPEAFGDFVNKLVDQFVDEMQKRSQEE
ncbi:MAG: DUF6092 family protein [Candidatus Heimdallarchaeota archaeon]